MVEFRDGSGRQTKVSNLATTGAAGGAPNFSTCHRNYNYNLFCLLKTFKFSITIIKGNNLSKYK